MAWKRLQSCHYIDVIMGAMASQITSFAIVYSTVNSGADQIKRQSSVSLAFVWGIHRGPVNSPHKGPVTRKMLPFDDVIMSWTISDPSHWRIQAEPWWRASIWRSHRKVVIKQCSYHNNIIDIQNRLPYSKVVYPAIIVLFSCLMEVNHGVRTGPDYPFR